MYFGDYLIDVGNESVVEVVRNSVDCLENYESCELRQLALEVEPFCCLTQSSRNGRDGDRWKPMVSATNSIRYSRRLDHLDSSILVCRLHRRLCENFASPK